MRVVIYTHDFNINNGSPCTKRMDSFGKKLIDNGHEVIILTGSHNRKSNLNKKNFLNNYKIIYSFTLALGKKKNIYRFIEQISFAISSFFVGFFRLGRADFFIVTSPPPLSSLTGFFLSKLKHSKIIYDVRDIWPDVAVEMGSFDEKSIYYKVFNFISNFMFNHSNYITTVSPGKVSKIKNYCKDDKSKVWYIPNGFDDNFLKFSVDKNIIKKYNLDKKFTVVYTGNIGLAQNLDALVELAKLYKNNDKIQFLMFGNGAYKDKLKQKIEDLNLKNISLNDKIDYEKIYTIMKYSKISFVSLKNNNMTDSIPTKMFDALGVGCPVILLASGDSVDILKKIELGENAKNIEELIDKFKYMVDNYSKYDDSLRQNAISYIFDNYSREKIAETFLKKLNNIKNK